MFNWAEITVKQEQYKELIDQANKERLIRRILGQKQHTRLSQAINWLSALLLLRAG